MFTRGIQVKALIKEIELNIQQIQFSMHRYEEYESTIRKFGDIRQSWICSINIY